MYRAFDSLEEMIVAASEAVRPSERLTVSQAAEKYRYLDNPGSYIGYWDNNFAPYLVEPMDVLTSLDYTAMILAGPARCGKSDIAFNWLTYSVICDPADMMMVSMTQNTARDWSKGDLRKVFRHSKEVGARVAPGRQNLNTHDISFISGMKLLVKWPTITELSGKTIPRVWFNDYDRMPEDIDKEGAPFALGKKRTQTYGRYGMTVAESSPGYEVTDPKWISKSPHEAPPTRGILALYNGGDRRRWYWRCFECGTSFEPDFHLLVYPDSEDIVEAAEATRLQCPFCEAKFGYERKQEFNRLGRWLKDGQRWLADGRIVGEGVRSDTASFWLKGPAAAFMDWKSIVLNYLKAMREYELTGSTEALKVTVNTDQGLPFSPKGIYDDHRTPEDLKDAAEEIGEKVVPEGVRFLVACIDVQANRFTVQVHGFGRAKDIGVGDITVIDRFDIRKSERLDQDGEHYPVKPSAYIEDWKLLIKQVIRKNYPLADGSGRTMQIKLVVCDSGGEGKRDSTISTTSNAYNFWRFLRNGPEGGDDESGWEPGMHRRFLLLKGAPGKSAPRVQIRYPDSDQKGRAAGARGEIPVLFLNSNLIKDSVSGMLDRKTEGGRVRFPAWLPDWFYTELLAEVRTPKGWENPRNARNEAFDLLCYAFAAAISTRVGIETIRWDDPPKWAAEWGVNDLVASAEAERRFDPKTSEDLSLEDLAKALA